jgi:hypothetical protein
VMVLPVTLQHVIGTISILVLTIGIGISFTLVSSYVQADINKKELAQVADYVSLNLVEIAILTNSSNYAPITMVKTINPPTELGGRAYTIELINATNQGKGYLVRASLVTQPNVNVESIIPLNSTALMGQMIVAAASNSPWGGAYVPDSKPAITYATKLYGGNNAVVWARQQESNLLYLGIGYLKA